MRRVLVLEANGGLRQAWVLGLRDRGIEAEVVDGVGQAKLALSAARFDAVILGSGGVAVSDLVALTTDLGADIVAMLDGDFEAGIRALREGATDFVPAGAGVEGLAVALRKMEARRAHAANAARKAHAAVGGGVALADAVATDGGTAPRKNGQVSGAPCEPGKTSGTVTSPVMVGDSPKIGAVLSLVRRIAGVKASVLVGGESGTGKELVAQALHDQSPWRDGPFVAVNCGAIPAGLIESELFGHVRGAFTDAVRDKQGLFQAAHGGTLFLDEIADLPLLLQSKLLRAIQDGVIRRVGDVEDMKVEVRVVAATARDLTREVAARQFREDLYYRLAGLTIHLPPLRERREDIAPLARHFLTRARARLGVTVHEIDDEALRLLTLYSWPGNVRELENTIERAAVLCYGDRVDAASLPERMVPPAGRPAGFQATEMPTRATAAGDAGAAPENLSIKQAARRSEEELIRRALRATGGNRTRAAELLEISHRALLYKIKEYGISVTSGREV